MQGRAPATQGASYQPERKGFWSDVNAGGEPARKFQKTTPSEVTAFDVPTSAVDYAWFETIFEQYMGFCISPIMKKISLLGDGVKRIRGVRLL
jgi:hypothetical protein